MIFERLYIGLPTMVAVFSTLDVNLAMSLVAVLSMVLLAPRYFKNRDLRADNERLRLTVDTRDKIIEGNELRVRQLETDLAGAQARANAAREEAIEWKGAYNAIKPYTAEPALRKLERLLEKLDERNQETNNLIRRMVGEHSTMDPARFKESHGGES